MKQAFVLISCSLLFIYIIIFSIEKVYKYGERSRLLEQGYEQLLKAEGNPAVCIGPVDCNEVPCGARVTYEAIGPGTSHPYIPRADGMEGRGIPGTLTFIKGNVIKLEYFGDVSYELGMPDANWTEATFRNGTKVLLGRDPTWTEADFSNCKCSYVLGPNSKRSCVDWSALK